MLELAIVLAIIGIVTAIALPAYDRLQRNSRFSSLINDLRILTGAFQHYNSVNGGWPPLSTEPGDIPTGMQDFLRSTNWTRRTVIGGHYAWENNVTHHGRRVRAAISIYPTEADPVRMTPEEMQQFDRRFDDGNLTTGFFQSGYLDLPLYVIEDDPEYAAASEPSTPPPATDPTAPDVTTQQEAQAKAEAKAAAEAEAKAAAEAKAEAEALAAAAAEKKAAAGAALNVATDRLKQLTDWADRLDRNVPRSLRNKQQDVQAAYAGLTQAGPGDSNAAKLAQDFADNLAGFVQALDQYEETLQAAQDRQDKKKGG